MSVYLKKGAVSRCTALSVCLQLLLLEIGSRVGAEQGMAVKGGARLNHRVSCSFCFEEHTDATGERQRKRLFISFSLLFGGEISVLRGDFLGHWRGLLEMSCQESDTGNTVITC